MQPVCKMMIEAAVHAPSGENCQPWKFRIAGDVVHIYNVPDRDQSLYSWGQRASFVALGAAIENMAIAAAATGYATIVDIFPSAEDEQCVATIRPIPGAKNDEGLAQYIPLRTSNRKPYKKTALTDEERSRLRTDLDSATPARFVLVENRFDIKKLAHDGSQNERVMLSNQHLHSFFFSHINWTSEEDKQKSIGFYIKTLELPLPARLAFHFFRNWRRMSVANVMGMPNLVSVVNAQVYDACAAVGGIIIPTDSREDFLAAGRALQRVWLSATAAGLYIQPMSGLLFLWLQVQKGDKSKFSQKQCQIIEQTYREVREIFGCGDQLVAMMFRIGHASSPSARASRLPPIMV